MDEAKKIYRKVRRDSHSPEAVMRALNGLSVLADEVDADYVEAIRLNTKLIKVANSIPDDHYFALDRDRYMRAAMTNLGLFHKGLGNYPAAIEISRQALDLAIKMDKPREILESQINYASVLHAQGSNAELYPC